MDFDHGGPSASNDQHESAAEIARKRVLAAYSSTLENLKNLPSAARDALMGDQNQTQNYSDYQAPQYQSTEPNWSAGNYDASAAYQRTPIYSQPYDQNYSQTYDQNYSQSAYAQPAENNVPNYNLGNYDQVYELYNRRNQSAYAQPVSQNPADETQMLKDAPVNQAAVSEEWQKYHSAWQDYYKNYYSDYYAKAAESYLATEKLKSERLATGAEKRVRTRHHFAPIFALVFIVLVGLFLQYNRLIFAPIMAYVSPASGSVSSNLEAVDPNVAGSVSPEPRLIIPKLNIDVPVAFNIPLSEVDAAMLNGVAQFSIPGASALPGQIGNLVITGHSAGDIYSSNPYKFIFSGLERLETGDLIYINYNSVRYTYKMTKRETVEPTDVAALVYETDKPMVTLITCTPLGTSRFRLLISAEQISPTYAGAEPAAPAPDQPSDGTMPANSPSFFDNVWRGLFGN